MSAEHAEDIETQVCVYTAVFGAVAALTPVNVAASHRPASAGQIFPAQLINTLRNPTLISPLMHVTSSSHHGRVAGHPTPSTTVTPVPAGTIS
jgi:hypothetical protein